MLTRVVAFGCSYTQGVGLEQHIDHLSVEASQLAWPQQLANMLELTCVNMGFGGQSAKYVTREALRFEYQKGDIVCIQWPTSERTTFFKYDKLQEDVGQLLALLPVDERFEDYYLKYYTDYDAMWQQLSYIDHVDRYLRSKNIPVVHLSLGSMIINETVNTFPETFDFFNAQVHNFPTVLTDGTIVYSEYDKHYGVPHHVECAKNIITILRQKNLIE